MTHSIVEALEKTQSHSQDNDFLADSEEQRPIPNAGDKLDEDGEGEYDKNDDQSPRDADKEASLSSRTSNQPSLADPEIGKPISHSQILDLSRQLKAQGLSPSSLDLLLRGSKVYIPPPPAKPEPTSEYKALMARLRREEESRAYERMINPPPPMETFQQRFPASSAAHAFALDHQPLRSAEDDEVTYADIDRQMAVVINVVVSVLACAGGLWVVARWWNTPARLALSMAGSILVGVAEVVVYMGYLKRVGDAKGKAKGLQEVKEVIKTWTVGGGKELEEGEVISEENSVLLEEKVHPNSGTTRKRKKDNL